MTSVKQMAAIKKYTEGLTYDEVIHYVNTLPMTEAERREIIESFGKRIGRPKYDLTRERMDILRERIRELGKARSKEIGEMLDIRGGALNNFLRHAVKAGVVKKIDYFTYQYIEGANA